MATVLITGCSTGIGRATAAHLTERGHEVIATARKTDALEGLDVARRLALDVQDDASVARVLEEVGSVDALVSNAGIAVRGPVEATPMEEAQRLFDVNVLGAMRVARAFVPTMRERGSGALVFVSSVVGRVAMPLGGVYSASKYALEALAETLRLEAGHFGVRVALIEPGVVDTGAFEASPAFVTDDGAYGPLVEQLSGGFGPAVPVGEVAAAIAGAVERPDGGLRVPVGEVARQLLGARSQMDDAEFEATLKGALGLRW